MNQVHIPSPEESEAILKECLKRRTDLVARWRTSEEGYPELILNLHSGTNQFSVELQGEPILYRVAGGFIGLEWARMDDTQDEAFDDLLEDAFRYLRGDFHRETRERWFGRRPRNVIVIHGVKAERPLEDGPGGHSSMYLA